MQIFDRMTKPFRFAASRRRQEQLAQERDTRADEWADELYTMFYDEIGAPIPPTPAARRAILDQIFGNDVRDAATKEQREDVLAKAHPETLEKIKKTVDAIRENHSLDVGLSIVHGSGSGLWDDYENIPEGREKGYVVQLDVADIEQMDEEAYRRIAGTDPTQFKTAEAFGRYLWKKDDDLLPRGERGNVAITPYHKEWLGPDVRSTEDYMGDIYARLSIGKPVGPTDQEDYKAEGGATPSPMENLNRARTIRPELLESISKNIEAAYKAGLGGTLSDDDIAALTDLKVSQQEYAEQFIKQMERGELTRAQILRRARMYAGASRAAFEMGRASAIDIHLPAFPGQGCDGGSNCRCWWNIQQLPDRVEATWEAVGDDGTCGWCDRNAKRYAPYVITKDGLAPEESIKPVSRKLGKIEVRPRSYQELRDYLKQLGIKKIGSDKLVREWAQNARLSYAPTRSVNDVREDFYGEVYAAFEQGVLDRIPMPSELIFDFKTGEMDSATALAAYDWASKQLLINLNRTSFWVDNVQAIDSQKNNWTEIGSRAGAVIHELGHSGHIQGGPLSADQLGRYADWGELDYDETDGNDPSTLRGIAREVSEYAESAPFEFVAEVYAGSVEGIKYSDEVYRLYENLGGPMDAIRRARGESRIEDVDALTRVEPNLTESLLDDLLGGQVDLDAPQQSRTYDELNALLTRHNIQFYNTDGAARKWAALVSREGDPRSVEDIENDLHGRVYEAVERAVADGLDLPRSFVYRWTGIPATDDTLAEYRLKERSINIFLDQGGWWASDAKAAESADKGFLESNDRVGTILHEFAHADHFPKVPAFLANDFTSWFSLPAEYRPGTLSAVEMEEIARQVSTYAAANPYEFVSEVYAGTYEGNTYSDEVYELYRKLEGPEIVLAGRRDTRLETLAAPSDLPNLDDARITPRSQEEYDAFFKALGVEVPTAADFRETADVWLGTVPPPNADEERERIAGLLRGILYDAFDITTREQMTDLPSRVEIGIAGYRAIASYHPNDRKIVVDFENLKSFWESPAEGAELERKGWLTVGDRRGVIIHELGHSDHISGQPYAVLDDLQEWQFVGNMRFGVPGDTTTFMQTARMVSTYAAESPMEFVAEVFAGRRFDVEYNPEIYRLYEGLGGFVDAEMQEVLDREYPDRHVTGIPTSMMKRAGAPATVFARLPTEDILATNAEIWKSEATREEVQAILSYQQGFELNDYLRFDDRELTDEIREQVRQMDAALDRSVTNAPLTVYRGISISSLDKDVRAEFANLKPGALFTDDGFPSASLSEEVAQEFGLGAQGAYILEIRVPAGAEALYIADLGVDYYQYQKELLLQRGATFRVIEVHEPEQVRQKDFYVTATKIVVEMLPPDQPPSLKMAMPQEANRIPDDENLFASAFPNEEGDTLAVAGYVPGGYEPLFAPENIESTLEDLFVNRPGFEDAYLYFKGVLEANKLREDRPFEVIPREEREIYATVPEVDIAEVRRLVESEKLAWNIEAIRLNGQLHILDGHEEYIAAMVRGDVIVEMAIIDADHFSAFSEWTGEPSEFTAEDLETYLADEGIDDQLTGMLTSRSEELEAGGKLPRGMTAEQFRNEFSTFVLKGVRGSIEDGIKAPSILGGNFDESTTQAQVFPNEMSMYINLLEGAEWTSDASSKEQADIGWHASPTRVGIIEHEMGHIGHLAASMDDPTDTMQQLIEFYNYADTRGEPIVGFTRNEEEIANLVSQYGNSNPMEFVAEVYSGTRAGKLYDKDVYQLYDFYGGPQTLSILDAKKKQGATEFETLFSDQERRDYVDRVASKNANEIAGYMDEIREELAADASLRSEELLSSQQDAWEEAKAAPGNEAPVEPYVSTDSWFEFKPNLIAGTIRELDGFTGAATAFDRWVKENLETGKNITEVPISIAYGINFSATKKTVNKAAVDMLIAFPTEGKTTPKAIVYKNQYIIYEGLEDFIAARVRGDSNMEMYVFDLDRYDESKKTPEQIAEENEVWPKPAYTLDEAKTVFERLGVENEDLVDGMKEFAEFAKKNGMLPDDMSATQFAAGLVGEVVRGLEISIAAGVAPPQTIAGNQAETTTLAEYLPGDDDAILINANAGPAWFEDTNRQERKDTGYSSTGTRAGVMVHEMGHKAHLDGQLDRWEDILDQMTTFEDFPILGMKFSPRAIAHEVSEYAGTNPAEFVAEVFSGAEEGDRYSPEVYRLYDFYGGYQSPKIVAAKADLGVDSTPIFRQAERDDILRPARLAAISEDEETDEVVEDEEPGAGTIEETDEVAEGFLSEIREPDDLSAISPAEKIRLHWRTLYDHAEGRNEKTLSTYGILEGGVKYDITPEKILETAKDNPRFPELRAPLEEFFTAKGSARDQFKTTLGIQPNSGNTYGAFKDTLAISRIKKLLSDPDKAKPKTIRAIRIDGVTYIQQGEEELVAARLRGDEEAEIELFDMDSYRYEPEWGTPEATTIEFEKPSTTVEEAKNYLAERGVTDLLTDRARAISDLLKKNGDLPSNMSATDFADSMVSLVVDGMKIAEAAGVPLPKKVTLDEDDPQTLAKYTPTRDEITINGKAGQNFWNNEAAQENFGFGWSSTSTRTGTMVHEMGHKAHVSGATDDWEELSDELSRWESVVYPTMSRSPKKIARTVSQYASTNPFEFVAEVFSGAEENHTYDADVYRLYDFYGGFQSPKILAAKAQLGVESTPLRSSAERKDFVSTLIQEDASRDDAALDELLLRSIDPPTVRIEEDRLRAEARADLDPPEVKAKHTAVELDQFFRKAHLAENVFANIEEVLEKTNRRGVMPKGYTENSLRDHLATEIMNGIAQSMAQGVPLPREIEVLTDSTASGNTAAYYPSEDVIRLGIEPTEAGLEPWADLESFKENKRKGWSQVDRPGSIIVHELGHKAHFDALGQGNPGQMRKENAALREWPLEIPGFAPGRTPKVIAEEVSSYATTNPLEFVAEVFTGATIGNDFAPDALELYDYFGGPQSPAIVALKEKHRVTSEPLVTTEARAERDIEVMNDLLSASAEGDTTDTDSVFDPYEIRERLDALEEFQREAAWIDNIDPVQARVSLTKATKNVLENIPDLESLKPLETLNRYKDGIFSKHNGLLRTVDATSWSPEERQEIADLDAAVMQARVPVDVVTWKAAPIVKGSITERLTTLRPGDIYEESGFLSTTLDRSLAEEVAASAALVEGAEQIALFKIVVPAGTSGMFLGVPEFDGKADAELLLPRGQQMLVRKVEKIATLDFDIAAFLITVEFLTFFVTTVLEQRVQVLTMIDMYRNLGLVSDGTAEELRENLAHGTVDPTEALGSLLDLVGRFAA